MCDFIFDCSSIIRPLRHHFKDIRYLNVHDLDLDLDLDLVLKYRLI